MNFWCWVITPIIGAMIYVILHERRGIKRWLTSTKQKVDKKIEDLK